MYCLRSLLASLGFFATTVLADIELFDESMNLNIIDSGSTIESESLAPTLENYSFTVTVDSRVLYDDFEQTSTQWRSSGVFFDVPLNFAFGSAYINAETLFHLDELATVFKLAVKNYTLEITGHTDSIGNYFYNQRLSERRARAVKNYLVMLHNIDQSRMKAVGLGESTLLDWENPASPVNRRVEFRFVAD